MAKSSNADDIIALVAVGGALYFLWKNDIIQTVVSTADDLINPGDVVPDAPASGGNTVNGLPRRGRGPLGLAAPLR